MLRNVARVIPWQPPHTHTRERAEMLSRNTETLLRVYRSQERRASKVRYWATEFEHPEAGNCANLLGHLLGDAKHDPTIPPSVGRCNCPICNHKCDCGHCTRRFQNCSTAHCTEVTMAPTNSAWRVELSEYIRALKDTGLDPEDFEGWCADCDTNANECGCEWDIEDKSNWGFHTHVDARDLTIRQVASVLRLGNRILSQWEDAYGYDGYTDGWTDEQTITDLANGEGSVWGRDRINAAPVLNYFARLSEADRQDPSDPPHPAHKATIEFRQFRYTGNPDLHGARVATARAIVDYIKAGKPTFWLLREPDFEKVLTELEIWQH